LLGRGRGRMHLSRGRVEHRRGGGAISLRDIDVSYKRAYIYRHAPDQMQRGVAAAARRLGQRQRVRSIAFSDDSHSHKRLLAHQRHSGRLLAARDRGCVL
jgi:hypothetical protein